MLAIGNSLSAAIGLLVILLAAVEQGATSAANDKRALHAVQAYVGTWRGVGQPKRGSNQGAWTEQSQWAWRFAGGHAELAAEITGNKFHALWQVQAGEKPGQFVLLATRTADQSEDNKAAGEKQAPRRFTGAVTDGALVFTADDPQSDQPARITLRLVAGGDRMLVLYEKRVAAGAYVRLAEVGATRKGSSFAKNVATGPECVVTGGLGTIVVEHKGKKYYVCCTDCRDYFLEDPETVLAEYRARKEEEKKK